MLLLLQGVSKWSEGKVFIFMGYLIDYVRSTGNMSMYATLGCYPDMHRTCTQVLVAVMAVMVN